MAGGGVVVHGGSQNYKGGVTTFVVFACIVAAMGGLIFGYDLGISGGVTSMEDFLNKFFPSIERKKERESGHDNAYCKFDNYLLTLFTSSLYLAALVASFFASAVTRVFGRKPAMFFGGSVFLIGSILNAVAQNIALLIVGRLLLGVGVGFGNQSVPVYLSEMAPTKIRGALNMGFQMAITIGILVANLVNYGTNKISGGWGWRLSLGLAGVPAILMTVGAIFLPETPNSIIERGNLDKAKTMLQKIRGADEVDEEFQDLIDASETAKKVKHPLRNIIQRKYRPELVMCCLIPFFLQLTGINVITFYAPVLFKTLGFGDNSSLMSAVITGTVNVLATLVSIFTVDKFGRRILFLEGGVQMLLCLIAVAVMIGAKFGTSGQGSFSDSEADLLLFFICAYVAAFAWSWGPLGWLVPSEICPLEIRPAGQAINVSVGMLFTFFIAEIFLTLLCHMKFCLFFFFAFFVVIMTISVAFFVPETKNVPIEEMNRVWKAHWFWKRYIPDEALNNTGAHVA
ncbi:hypothetical protein FNV43_RR06281 [Rhamnella rubrinervis]|uniref:Major facilitator superfamily (MFS) profile domain-containing protein n=1 Tax=Rhamnella rubrinervis TaxID=2594499 RepID=A0A8K0ML54_9ROSA|nr:hypothetical protein FNV43_RR06281 [Rhamnella rubrinervis]